MNLAKQTLLVNYLLSDSDLFTRCNAILDQNYFDPEVRHSVHFMKEYYENYRALPSNDQIIAETGNSFEPKQLTKAEIEYALVEIETYCRNKAMERAVLSAPSLMAKNDHGKVLDNLKEAISVSINRDVGLDYFSDPLLRIQRMLLRNAPLSLGYKILDEYLNGGPSRKELLLFMAGSGVGKSIFMTNVAINLLMQKLNVVYITLELAEDVVAKRFDSMITGISQKEIFAKMNKVSADLERKQSGMGKLFIKRMPESTTNANHIRAYLKEFEMAHGFIPDAVVVDYMDLMTSNQKISAENLFVKDKYIAEELRSIGNDFDVLIISASQMNRAAIKTDDIDQSNIAGGISKINTCDNLIAIIQTEAMKAAGEYMLKIVKSRNSNGVGKIVMLRWDHVSLRVRDFDDMSQDKIQFVPRDNTKPQEKKKDLLDLLNANNI